MYVNFEILVLSDLIINFKKLKKWKKWGESGWIYVSIKVDIECQ